MLFSSISLIFFNPDVLVSVLSHSLFYYYPLNVCFLMKDGKGVDMDGRGGGNGPGERVRQNSNSSYYI